MKPLKLELQAFGPYVSKQTVNFEKLSQKGMFLIKGETGSGKTTIFDAMTFALYGGSSGENDKSRVGRNDLEEWRCNQADDNLETFVSFTFSVRDRKYYFIRRLVPKRINLSAQYEAGEIDEDGNVIPFFTNPKKDDLTRKAEELIGLNKEQFRQVVLLPQGQFERFLTANSNDKEAILQKIFESDQWEKYASSFYDDVYTRKSSLEKTKNEIMQSLEEEGLENIEELNKKIEKLNDARNKLIKEHNLFNGEKKQQELADDWQLFERFKSLHEDEKALRELDKAKLQHEENKRRYASSEKADPLRNLIKAADRTLSDFINRSLELEKLNRELPEKYQAKTDAENQKIAHEEASPVTALSQLIGEYKAKIDAYSNIDSLTEAFSTANNELIEAQKSYTDSKTAFDTASDTAVKCKSAFDEADRIAKDFRDRYYDSIYGEIASGLSEGKACPVCGSKTHPMPAVKTLDSVSKSDVDEKEEDRDTKKIKWDSAEEARKEAGKDKDRKQQNSIDADKKKREAEVELNAAKKNLIDGILNTKELYAAIQEFNNSINIYQDEAKSLKDKYDNAAKAYNTHLANIETAETEKENAETDYQKAKETLESALTEKGYSDVQAAKADLLDSDTRNKIHTQIVEYDTKYSETTERLNNLGNELKDQIEPDSSKFEERQQQITEEAKNFGQKNGILETDIDRLSQKFESLSEKQAYYDSHIIEAENDLAFAKKLRGDTGIGLQRYVLAIMFNQVIGEANRMLSKVHGGRYHLFRSDDKGAGNKRGLELKVHDSRSPEKEGRSVGMLSGGEKFLVSLALSIGMSTVAQKSGVQIEALFIDEGFGTLDDNSIHDAMDVLDSVRKGNGMIGIISHVQLLEANIPTHLEVIKTEKGSSISIS